ncbi:MAG: hypothetical protein ACPGTU_10080 [Myxococcota bacterium]
MRNVVSLGVLLVLSGCADLGYRGVITNGMDGSTMSGVRVVATATPRSADLTCQVRETTTLEDGSFEFENLCRDQLYLLDLPKGNLQLSGVSGIKGGEQLTTGELQAWRSPEGQGVYRLNGEKVQPIPTFSDVTVDAGLNGEVVRYPDLRPTGRVITIEPGMHLIISGKRNVKDKKFFPLIQDEGRRRLRSGIITNHVYFGVKFKSDKEMVSVPALMNQSKVRDVLLQGRPTRYISSDAFPPGRYALLTDIEDRVVIVDFGTSQAPAK